MLKRLYSEKEFQNFAREFKDAIKYCEVPASYFATGKTYAWFKNGKIIAGFALINGYDNLRAVQHLPQKIKLRWRYTKIGRNLCEHTGFFITPKLKGIDKIIYGLQMFWICLFHNRQYFIYSYRYSETHLEKYYSTGKPLSVYSGPLKPLEGYNQNETPENEHVEVLSKVGLAKIIFYRILKIIF